MNIFFWTKKGYASALSRTLFLLISLFLYKFIPIYFSHKTITPFIKFFHKRLFHTPSNALWILISNIFKPFFTILIIFFKSDICWFDFSPVCISAWDIPFLWATVISSSNWFLDNKLNRLVNSSWLIFYSDT